MTQRGKLVWQTAQELNYPLEKLRVAPPVSRSVLVLIRDDGVNDSDLTISREFERNVWMGVQSVFEQRGIATRLQSTKMLPEEATQYAADAGISGLVLVGGVSDHDFFRQLMTRVCPLSSLARTYSRFASTASWPTSCRPFGGSWRTLLKGVVAGSALSTAQTRL